MCGLGANSVNIGRESGKGRRSKVAANLVVDLVLRVATAMGVTRRSINQLNDIEPAAQNKLCTER